QPLRPSRPGHVGAVDRPDPGLLPHRPARRRGGGPRPRRPGRALARPAGAVSLEEARRARGTRATRTSPPPARRGRPGATGGREPTLTAMDTLPPPEDSALRRVSREAAVLGGAGYAILLQVAHPAVGQGVHDHSDFASRPLDRLRGTLTFVYGVVFGTPAEAERISAIVRALHTRVTGPGYRALDPQLLLWVAATLYRAAETVYDLAVGDLTDAEKDEAYAHSAVLATALGCPPEYWPPSRADFDRYWARTLASLRVTPAARTVVRELLHPASPLLCPAARVQGFLAAGLLPPGLREELGLAWDARRQRRFDRTCALVRAVYPRLPLRLRTSVRDALLWDIRRRIARNRLYRRPRGWRPVLRGAAAEARQRSA